MEKEYELKTDYISSQDNAAQKELLEISSIIEDAPLLFEKESSHIFGGTGKGTCRCNCKCKSPSNVALGLEKKV